jgi:Trypsin
MMVKALLGVALAHLAFLPAIARGDAAAHASLGEDQPGSEHQHRSLIMKGTPASNLEFPFYVQSKSVRFDNGRTGDCLHPLSSRKIRPLVLNDATRQATCGGSLVAKDVVATAAHCAGT